MLGKATSINGKTIRLTLERWEHITNGHSELKGMEQDVLETVSNPERILAGSAGEVLAVRELYQGKFLVVVYREEFDDGFVITAFLTRRFRSLNRRIQLWT